MTLARITTAAGPAEFGDHLRWTSPVPGLADALNALASAEDDSPARGRWWVAHVAAVAAATGGRAQVAPRGVTTPGRIY